MTLIECYFYDKQIEYDDNDEDKVKSNRFTSHINWFLYSNSLQF